MPAFPQKRPAAVPAFAALWLLAVGVGWYWLEGYGLKPGKCSGVTSFPTVSVEHSVEAEGTLFVSLHPECSCSEATVGELARIAGTCGRKLEIVAVFAEYDSLPRKVEESRLWKAAAVIPGLTPMVDHDGSIRNGLGALTSGDCVMKGRDGTVLFRGGITRSRGHAGASRGGDAIISLAHGAASGPVAAPVFGCPLTGGGAG